MKLSELKKIIDRCVELSSHTDDEVVVEIRLPYSTIGSKPCTQVKSANSGFDWDKGKFMISTVETLTLSDKDFDGKMREMQEKLGWADYENRNLKKEIKRLKSLLNVENNDNIEGS